MSSQITWRPDGQSSSDGVHARMHLQEGVLDNRVEMLREAALTVLREVESLRSARLARVDGSVRLCDEVQRFEIDLIRSALDRTGGNQLRAARLLGVKPTTLNAKLKRYKISFIGREGKSEQDIHNHEIAA
ncbi:MAG TPA: helix-turn-helix domain-containing protein [Pyrinomonadaceae bacterium]|nr:helix-turn-helix domain-containing protein [Pyrinomonadaceae bacterium]